MRDRLIWILHRRLALKRKLPGFRAHWSSYADHRCRFGGFNSLLAGSELADVSLGRFTYISGRVKSAETEFGSFCSVGPEALIGGLGRHPTNWASTHPGFYSTMRQAGYTFSETRLFEERSRTRIGSDVWIGARAIVLDGVDVGDGAIIGAGAVVVKNVPPYAVVGGVPAKTIRFRFSDEMIALLRSLRWWDWSLDDLTKHKNLFQGPLDEKRLEGLKRLAGHSE